MQAARCSAHFAGLRLDSLSACKQTNQGEQPAIRFRIGRFLN